MENFEIVKDEVKHEDDVVLCADDWYKNSAMCDFVMPVPETDTLNYVVLKDIKEDASNKFVDVHYEV